MYAVSNNESHRSEREDDIARKRKKKLNNTDIENYFIDQNDDDDNGRGVKGKKIDDLNGGNNDDKESDTCQTARHPIVRILERRYPLTATGYKYLSIGINTNLPSYVSIVLGDCHGKEVSLSPDIWKELLDQKRTVLSLLHYNENKGSRTPSPICIGNLTLRFGRINNLPILRLETSTTRLAMSKSTVLCMFNLEYCANRLMSSLATVTENVDRKLSRFLDIASAVSETANMSKTIHESFDRNDIIECELIALIFGEH